MLECYKTLGSVHTIHDIHYYKGENKSKVVQYVGIDWTRVCS